MKINTQTISKQNLTAPQSLQIHSIFPTIQGEGIYAGQPAIFIRLAGCNLQCPFCDTEYTEGSYVTTPLEIVATVMSKIPTTRTDNLLYTNNAPLVVITGGEPFRQDIRELVKVLLNYGLRIQIETNGTLFIEDFNLLSHVTVICSPKTGAINKKLIPYIDAYKYIIHAGKVSKKDGLPITSLEHSVKDYVARPSPLNKVPIYVQPADEQDGVMNMLNMQEAIKSSMGYGYTLCVQIHKIIGVE